MILRMHGSELMRLRETPLPWWDPEARAIMGRVMPGAPAAEYVDEEATGYYLIASPDLDEWDVWLLDVARQVWAYADAQADPQAVVDAIVSRHWDAWNKAKLRIERRELTTEEARDLAEDFALREAQVLGIGRPQKPSRPETIDELIDWERENLLD